MIDELAAYVPSSPEQEALRTQFLGRFHQPGAVSRDGRPDHVTASAVVFAQDLTQVLLVLHRKVGLWMQPGGHIEPDETHLSRAALREAVEETGVEGLALASEVPVHLERHPAPCGAEHHLDVRFLVLAPAASATRVSEESLDVAWWPVDALPELAVAGLDELVRAGLDAAGALASHRG